MTSTLQELPTNPATSVHPDQPWSEYSLQWRFPDDDALVIAARALWRRSIAWIVPVLLVMALTLVVLGPRIQAYARRRAEAAGRSVHHVSGRRMAALSVGTFVVGIYGGYFTAAQGILLVGLMGALLPEDLQRMNAAKNLLALLVNIVAATGYVLVASSRMNWTVVGVIAVGSSLGGLLGARYGRRLSPTALRAVIVIVGLIGLGRLLAL